MGPPAAQKKKTAALRGDPPSSLTVATDLEVDRDTRENVAPEGVVHLREGVSATSRRRRNVTSDERRATVEDVIRTEPEVVTVRNTRRQSQVEEALSRQNAVAREAVRALREVQVRIVAQRVVLDLVEVAPLTRNAEAVRKGEAGTELVPPLRIRRRERSRRTGGAGRSEEAGAIIATVETKDAGVKSGVEDQLLGQRCDEAQVQRAHARELVSIGAVEVEAVRLKSTDIDGLKRDKAARQVEQRASDVTVDETAEARIARQTAARQHTVERQCADEVLYLDVEVIDGEGEARDPARLQHDADRVRIGLFRREVHVAGELRVVLIGRVEVDGAVLCRSQARVRALRHSEHGGCAGAEVRAARQAQTSRTEQFSDVRRPDSAVVAGAQPDVADRGEFRRDLVAVRREAAAAVDLVVGVAIAARQRELLDEGVADDRNLDLREELANVEGARLRKRRTALAGEIAGLEFDVRVEVEEFLPILAADVDADATVGPRRLKAVFATFEREVDVGDGLVRVAALEAGGLQIVQGRCGNTAGLEDIPGHAVRVNAGHRSAADRCAHGNTSNTPGRRVRDYVDRTLKANNREVVSVRLRQLRCAELVVSVVGQTLEKVTANTADDAERRVLQIVLAATAFDVTPADQDRRERRRQARRRVDD